MAAPIAQPGGHNYPEISAASGGGDHAQQLGLGPQLAAPSNSDEAAGEYAASFGALLGLGGGGGGGGGGGAMNRGPAGPQDVIPRPTSMDSNPSFIFEQQAPFGTHSANPGDLMFRCDRRITRMFRMSRGYLSFQDCLQPTAYNQLPCHPPTHIRRGLRLKGVIFSGCRILASIDPSTGHLTVGHRLRQLINKEIKKAPLGSVKVFDVMGKRT